jgi:catalase
VIGKMVRDKNVENYFAETEQVAFCVRNVVPGVDFTKDPLLQGRIASYVDTQLSRLGGPNYNQLPINAPKCPVMNMQRDGHMQMRGQQGRVSYSPSSLEADSPRQDPHVGFSTFAEPMQGDKMRIRSESFADHFSQARQFFYSQSEPEQNHIVSAFIFELSKVDTKTVREGMVGQLANVDPKIATRVGTGLGMGGGPKPVPAKVKVREDLADSPKLSILKNAKATLQGRMIGCLVADGTDTAFVLALETAAAKLKADFKIIAPKICGAIGADGATLEADFQLAGGSSVLFDTVFVALSEEGGKLLSTEAAAVAWVHDAFHHLKVICATSGAQALLDAAGVVPDAGVLIGGDAETFLTTAAAGRVWDREPSVRTVF